MKIPFVKKICFISILSILVSSCTGKGFSNGNSSSIFTEMTKIEDIERIDLEELKNRKFSLALWSGYTNTQYNKINDFINDFNKIFPNIEIIQLDQGNIDDLDYNLRAAVVAKKTPSIAIIEHSYISDYISYNSLENMNSYLLAQNTKFENNDQEDYIKELWLNNSSYSLDNSVYSLPLFNYSNVIYYNSTFINNIDMNKLNWSNDDENSIINVLRDIKNQNKDIIPLYVENPTTLYKLLTYQFNIPYTKLTGTVKGKFLFANNEIVEIIKMVKSWIDEGLLVLGENLNIPVQKNPFVNDIAMAIAPTNYFEKYGLANNLIKSSLIPQANMENKYNEIISDDYIIFKNQPIENKIISWLFYKFITNKDNAIDLSLNCKTLPLRYSTLENENYNGTLSNKEDIKSSTLCLLKEVLKNIKSEPAFVGKRIADKEVGKVLMTVSNNDLSNMSNEQKDKFIKECLSEALKQSSLAQG